MSEQEEYEGAIDQHHRDAISIGMAGLIMGTAVTFVGWRSEFAPIAYFGVGMAVLMVGVAGLIWRDANAA